jgi:hypothetical protein
MTLKNDWQNGDLFTPAAANDMANAVNGAAYLVSAATFGAVGNGNTDDTTALQNWINYLVANHRQGWLPNGTYKITATLVAPSGYGWGITGESSSYTWIKQYANNVAILQIGTTTGDTHSVKLDNILFYYNTVQTSANQVTIVATGGTFTLSFGGYTTAAIAYNASTATVETRLTDLASVAPGEVTVIGSPGKYTIAFTVAGTLTGSDANLTGTKSVTITPPTGTAQQTANANCLDLRCATGGVGNFYHSEFTRLQFWRGYYGIKFLSNSYTPWGCVWDQLYMDTMSGGLLDQSGGLSSAANNRWGRVTMRCAWAVGPIFKEWGMYNSTVDCLEFVDTDQGAQLITTSNGFSADIGSIKLEIGTYTGAGTSLINFVGDYRVRLGSLHIGGPMTLTPSSGVLSAISAGGGAASDNSFLEINTLFLSCPGGTLSGQVVAVSGGGAPNRRISINSAQLDNGWTLQSTGSTVAGDYVTVRSWVNGALSDSQGDTNYTVTLGHPNAVHFNTAFTAQRTITLPASSSNNNFAGLYYDLIFDGAINGSNTALIKHGSTTLRTQSVDKKRLRYAWRRGGSGTGLWVLVDVADIDTPAVFLGSADSNILSQSLRANRAITGGGTITVDASSYVLWSTRFITVSNGRSTAFCPDGFWAIECPVSGTITGVGGASNKTATAAGIPLDAYESLYYILPLTSGQSSLPANFRVVGYTSTLEVPHNWVLICTRNGNNNVFSFNNGINLRAGESLNSIHQDTANTANTLVRRNASGNFSAGTITAALSGNATTATTATFCTSGMPDDTSTTMNARIIRNGNSSTLNDGMFIGYGNTGAGVTRIYGGGGTTNSVDVDSGGNLTVAGRLSVSGTTATIRAGTGTPESVVTANVGSIYLRTDGGAGTTLYIKESGAGNTGWVAK